jgi:hypothetical protein
MFCPFTKENCSKECILYQTTYKKHSGCAINVIAEAASIMLHDKNLIATSAGLIKNLERRPRKS